MEVGNRKLKIFVVIPAYNCEKFILHLFERIPAKLYEKICKIIVINDGSIDNTQEIVEEITKKYKKTFLINNKKNEGYASVQKKAFDYCLSESADIVVILHDDGQYAPEEMENLLKPLESGSAEIVQGSRILGGKALQGNMPIVKFFGNRFLSAIENIICNMNLSEFHSGYMLYSRKALITIPYKKLSNSFHFDGEMLIVGNKYGLKINEMPISTNYLLDSRSNLKPIKYILDFIVIMFRFKRGYYR